MRESSLMDPDGCVLPLWFWLYFWTSETRRSIACHLNLMEMTGEEEWMKRCTHSHKMVQLCCTCAQQDSHSGRTCMMSPGSWILQTDRRGSNSSGGHLCTSHFWLKYFIIKKINILYIYSIYIQYIYIYLHIYIYIYIYIYITPPPQTLLSSFNYS